MMLLIVVIHVVGIISIIAVICSAIILIIIICIRPRLDYNINIITFAISLANENCKFLIKSVNYTIQNK